MDTSPPRETAASGLVPVAVHDAVLAENSNLKHNLTVARATIATHNKLGKFASGVGWFAVALPIAAVVVHCGWFVFIRGVAWGEAARRNAEREATAYVTRMRGAAPLGIACVRGGIGDFGSMNCVARMRDARITVTLNCDDDDPVTNDGCEGMVADDSTAKPVEMVPFADAGRR